MKSLFIVLVVFFFLSCDNFSSDQKNSFAYITNNDKNPSFDKILKKGVYFKNGYDMGVLLTQDQLFLIAFDSVNLDKRTFVHFLREDGSFVNNSFSKKRYIFHKKLNLNNKNIRIAKVEIENIKEYPRIRIGQYTPSGNTWMQLLSVEELFKNPLLRYHIDNYTNQLYDLNSKTE